MRNFRISPRACKKRCQLALILLTLIVLGACEIDNMTVKVSGGNPPTFDPHGSGNLGFFWVREASWDELKLTPRQRGMTEDKLIVWEIWPDGAADTKIWNLPDITYGQVPPGFRQTIPNHGNAPPLVEGKLYKAGGPASDASGGTVYFTIRNSQVTEVPQTY
jgi:hypothetical protein